MSRTRALRGRADCASVYGDVGAKRPDILVSADSIAPLTFRVQLPEGEPATAMRSCAAPERTSAIHRCRWPRPAGTNPEAARRAGVAWPPTAPIPPPARSASYTSSATRNRPIQRRSRHAAAHAHLIPSAELVENDLVPGWFARGCRTPWRKKNRATTSEHRTAAVVAGTGRGRAFGRRLASEWRTNVAAQS